MTFTAMPAVVDYPNHLTRIWLLAGGASNPGLSAVYIPDWSQASTSFGVDWIAAMLARIIPLTTVDSLLRIVMFVGPAIGAALLSRSIFGRWSIWQVAPLAFAFGTTSIMGFLNYSASITAALIGAAIISTMGSFDKKTLAAHLLISVVMSTIHPIGYIFYMALLLGIFIGPYVRPVSVRRAFAIFGLSMLYTIIGLTPFVAMHFIGKSAPGTNSFVFSVAQHLDPKYYMNMALSVISSYKIKIDLMFFFLVVAVLIWSILRKKARAHFGLVIAGALLAFLSLGMPTEIGDATFLDRRLPLMAALTLFAAILPTFATDRYRHALAAVLISAVLGKFLWVAYVWHLRDQDVADLAAVTSEVRPGQAVMPVMLTLAGDLRAPTGRLTADTVDFSRHHLATTLIMTRHALIPTLFAIKGQHPIRIQSLPRSEGRYTSQPPSLTTVIAGRGPGYIPGWECRYDYMLLLNADFQRGSIDVPPVFKTVVARPFSRLYALDPTERIARCNRQPLAARPVAG